MSILAVRKFGDTLRRLRRQRRLSQDELGAAAEVNGQTISNIETGKVEPRGDTYRAIARALGMTVEQLDAEWEPEPIDLNTDPYTEQPIPEIPTFDMTVAAGGWVEVSADDFGEDVPPGVVRGAQAIALGLFRIRVRGDSMQPAYPDGGVVEFRCLRQGHDGLVVGQDYYVQLSDGTATFKRLHAESDDELVFRALNRRKYPKLLPVPRGLVVRTARVVGRILPPADEQGR